MCYFFLSLLPFLLQVIFSLTKKGGCQYCSMKSLYLGKSTGVNSSFFHPKALVSSSLSQSMSASLSRLGLMHPFTPHKLPSSDQIGAASGPYLCKRYVSWDFKRRRLYIAKTLNWLVLQGIIFHNACVQPGKFGVLDVTEAGNLDGVFMAYIIL